MRLSLPHAPTAMSQPRTGALGTPGEQSTVLQRLQEEQGFAQHPQHHHPPQTQPQQGGDKHGAVPPQGTLTMLAILPQVLSVWMAKEDEALSMERPLTITI